MRKQLALGLVLALFVSSAFAYSCPGLMSDVDRALENDQVVADLSQSQLDKVRKLRDRGEKLHSQGKHGESVETLNEAKSILGID